MPNVLPDSLDSYLSGLLPARDETLSEMESYAAENRVPIIGPIVGRLIHQTALLSGAKRVFEMGSAIGYSTVWLARAVGQDGKVYYTDGSQENADRARDYLERAGVANRVEILVGDALELLESTEGQFDIVFNDVDKHDYPRVFDLALPRVRKGGVLITDNVLWSNRVLEPSEDINTKAIQTYNHKANSSAEVWTTVIPIRDGVSISLKL